MFVRFCVLSGSKKARRHSEKVKQKVKKYRDNYGKLNKTHKNDSEITIQRRCL